LFSRAHFLSIAANPIATKIDQRISKFNSYDSTKSYDGVQYTNDITDIVIKSFDKTHTVQNMLYLSKPEKVLNLQQGAPMVRVRSESRIRSIPVWWILLKNDCELVNQPEKRQHFVVAVVPLAKNTSAFAGHIISAQ
jgi:hypothetical protein